MKLPLLIGSHLLALAIGFGLGIYTLPILIAPKSLSDSDVAVQEKSAVYKGRFSRDRQGSDFLHWAEGNVHVGLQSIAFEGKVAPGPDYKLYLSPEFIETKEQFEAIKPRMVRVGEVRTFENFIVTLPAGVDIARYNTVIVWCETFHKFISSAKYR